MTTKFFFTMMAAVLMIFSTAATQAQGDDPAPVTKIILVTNHSDAEDFNAKKTKSLDKFADMLPGLFRTTHVDAVYSCKGAGEVSVLQPLLSDKSITVKTYDSGSLSKSLYDIYVENTGKTIVICGSETTIPQMLNMLSGTNIYGKQSKTDIYKIYMVDSDRLGKGTVQTHDLRKQI